MQAKKNIFIILLLLCSFTSIGQTTNYKTEAILDNFFIIDIPESFRTMNPDEVITYYEIENRPTIAFCSNDDPSINIGVRLNSVNLQEKDLKTYLPLLEKSFNEMYPKTEFGDGILWEKHQIETIHGKAYIHLKMVTPGFEGKLFNDMLIGSFQGQMMIMTFSCKAEMKDKWATIANTIISSLKENN